MIRKLLPSLMIAMILLLNACATAPGESDSAYPADDIVVETLDVNANDANTNTANENGNTNDSGIGNTNENSNLTPETTEPATTAAVTTDSVATGTPAVPAGTGLTASVETYDEFVTESESLGETLEPMGDSTNLNIPGFNEGQVHSLSLRGAPIQVVEFPDAATGKGLVGALQRGDFQIGQFFANTGEPAHVWSNGSLMVVYFGTDDAVIQHLSRLMGDPVIGEAPVTGDSPGDSPATPPAPLIAFVQEWIARQLNVESSQVQIGSVESMTWTDSCLGLGGPAESCLASPVSGWVVNFTVNGQPQSVHVSADGSIIRIAQPGEALP